jgi:hypothetical protein
MINGSMKKLIPYRHNFMNVLAAVFFSIFFFTLVIRIPMPCIIINLMVARSGAPFPARYPSIALFSSPFAGYVMSTARCGP